MTMKKGLRNAATDGFWQNNEFYVILWRKQLAFPNLCCGPFHGARVIWVWIIWVKIQTQIG